MNLEHNGIGPNGIEVLSEDFQFIPKLKVIGLGKIAIYIYRKIIFSYIIDSIFFLDLNTSTLDIPIVIDSYFGYNKIGCNGLTALASNFEFIPRLIALELGSHI